MRSRRVQAGGALVVLLGAILALAAAGAWNYHRNLRAEAAAEAARPLSGYATADLEALAAAYRQEIEVHAARYAAARARGSEARDRAHLDQQVREFENVQRRSAATRAAGAALAEREAELRRIEEELQVRGDRRHGWDQFLARLLTF